MAKVAIIMVGLPASGKSTYAAEFIADGFMEVNLDNCRETVSGDPSDQSCTPEAVKEHTRQIDEAISKDLDLVVSDTNLNKFFRDALIQKFVDAGYTVHVYIMDTKYDVCVGRNEARDRKVPAAAMDRMYHTFSAMDRSLSDFPGVSILHTIR